MKSSLNNLASIDDSIKSMLEFIVKCGREPVKPDAHGGKAYTRSKLGDLGEQYIECLFREMGITKLPEGEEPSPDFKIFVNGKQFLLEAKTVSNLYKPLNQLLQETAEEENDQTVSRKAKALFKKYDFDMTPFEVHRNDERQFKEELKGIIKAMESSAGETKTVIKCQVKTYVLSITPARVEGLSFLEGEEPDETKTLDNFISKNKEKIGSSDILLIILLNRTIDQDDLLDFFYGQREILVGLKLIGGTASHSQNLVSKISQYRYEQTIWGRKFQDEKCKVHTIDERLKCVIVIRPYLGTSLFFPSIKYFENFSTTEYAGLGVFLKDKGFRCGWATHNANLLSFNEKITGQ